MKHILIYLLITCISQCPAAELRIPFTGVIVNHVDNAILKDGIAYHKGGTQYHGMSMLSGPIQQSPLSFAKIMGDRYMGTKLTYTEKEDRVFGRAQSEEDDLVFMQVKIKDGFCWCFIWTPKGNGDKIEKQLLKAKASTPKTTEAISDMGLDHKWANNKTSAVTMIHKGGITFTHTLTQTEQATCTLSKLNPDEVHVFTSNTCADTMASVAQPGSVKNILKKHDSKTFVAAIIDGKITATSQSALGMFMLKQKGHIVSLSATVQERTDGTSARLWKLMQDIKAGLQISTDE